MDKVILENQVLIMKALLYTSSIPHLIKLEIREKIMFTEARIKAMI